MQSWSELGDWWRSELASDPAYDEVVTPLLLDMLEPSPGSTYVDFGCGDGRVMETVAEMGALVIGVDLNPDLARSAIAHGPVVLARLPDVLPLREESVDGAYSVLVLEHLTDAPGFFETIASVVRPGGVLALVINHPAWTAPDSTPITDEDGEILWRPGAYFPAGGSSEVRAGESTVTFHHRTTAALLNAAADAGWSLERVVERPHHEFDDQSGIPRLMACRWCLIR